MPDPIFAERRLAELYDPLDPDRSDLDAYAALVEEFGARSILDVGCGTGTFACMMARKGFDVVAVDPARASLEVARKKPDSDRVKWVLGDATTLPPLQVDLGIMTGNVAQVFLSDDTWLATLSGIRNALRPSGRVVFEVRDPSRKAWRAWNREETYERVDVPGVGIVNHWGEVTAVSGHLVTFTWTFHFERSGDVMTSDSTLRFRERDEIESSLRTVGLDLLEVRDAPDRPGLEFVFVAEKPA
ncbi:MAG: class I SAM-dependent methyltransferase [Ilumatobacteraceae bacterium]